nr:immunoglobulin heavy chain junction region [Mus musculus]
CARPYDYDEVFDYW